MVAWQGPDAGGGTDVFARRYDSSGVPLSGEFVVNTYTPGLRGSPRVQMSSSGFVVVWSSEGQDGDQGGIYGQRFSVNGVPNGGEFRINSSVTGAQRVSGTRDGRGCSSWSGRAAGMDGDLGGIFGQRYDDAGQAVGGEFAVNGATTGDQTAPDVVGAGDDFVVVWTSSGPDAASTGVFGHLFSWEAPVTADFRVAPQLSGGPSRPRVGRDSQNYPRGFIVVWQNSGDVRRILSRRASSRGGSRTLLIHRR